MYLSQENIEPVVDTSTDTGEVKIPVTIEEIRATLDEQIFFRTLLYGFITNAISKLIWRK